MESQVRALLEQSIWAENWTGWALIWLRHFGGSNADSFISFHLTLRASLFSSVKRESVCRESLGSPPHE